MIGSCFVFVSGPIDSMETDITLQMLAVFAVIFVTLSFYATEKLPLEVTSFGAICVLLVFFHFSPVIGSDGRNALSAAVLLAGFASPALLTVLALLVLGEGLAKTGVLDRVAVLVHEAAKGGPGAAVSLALIVVLFTSAFLNNIPVVVIFIPIMQSLAVQSGRSPSRYMMPLSYAAILGGMTTLIGSSTNLLVANELVELGEERIGFFSFTIPGLVIAVFGMLYLLFVAPRLLPERSLFAAEEGGSGKHFAAELTVITGSRFDGMRSMGGFFPGISDVTVLSIQRQGNVLLPPFDEMALIPGDRLLVAATRDSLVEAVRDDPRQLHPRMLEPDSDDEEAKDQFWRRGNQHMAEVMVTPSSNLVGQKLGGLDDDALGRCVAVGIERRTRMLRKPLSEIQIEAGDILLIQGRRVHIKALRQNKNVLAMEWSAENLARTHLAWRAIGVFGIVVGLAATGLLPTEISALAGAVLMILSGCISATEAIRALDGKIIFLIAAAFSLGAAMQETGGAMFLSDTMLYLLGDIGPAGVLSAFFLLVAVLANVLSTKATAVLFTPIAVAVARGLDVPAEAFAVAVIFAANCSFASPVGYQTNLLVMGPGAYRFFDFVKVGSPLLIVCWLAFSVFAPWYYGF